MSKASRLAIAIPLSVAISTSAAFALSSGDRQPGSTLEVETTTTLLATADNGIDFGNSVPTPRPGPVDAVAGNAQPLDPPRVAAPTPLPDLGGNDFSVVTNEFFRFVDWLRANPDPALVNQVFAAGSPAANHFSHDMVAAAADAGLRSSHTTEVLQVNVLTRTGNTATVRALTRIDSSGDVIEERLTFQHTPEGWRVNGRVATAA